MDFYFVENSGKEARKICDKKRKYIREQIMASNDPYYIKTFLTDLEKVPNFDLNLFYHNVLKVKFKVGNKAFNPIFERSLMGYYEPVANRIGLRKNYHYDDSSHEELHMATGFDPISENFELDDMAPDEYSKKFARLNFCGLTQDYGNYSIGRSANEGFTEVLVQRHFSQEKSFYYARHQMLALLLEEIVSSPVMYEAYSTADLPLLVHELEKYEHFDNIIDILMLDCNKDRNFIKIRKFLNDVLIRKYKELYKDHKISYDELIYKLSYLSDTLKSKNIVKQYHGRFNLSTIRDVAQYNLQRHLDPNNVTLTLKQKPICQKGKN